MSRPAKVAAAALALVGAPFRLRGRDPESGVDCVGLVACALRAAGRGGATPAGYAMRNRDFGPWREWAARHGFVAVGSAAAGDVAVYRVGAAQLHLAVVIGEDLIVHAHAGLGRVVRSPVPEGWRLIGHWRVAED